MIAAPPTVPHRTGGTLLEVAFPVLGTMGIFVFVFVYPSKWLFLAALVFLLLSLAVAFGMRHARKREEERTARSQRARYRSYLADQEERLSRVAELQRDELERLYPDPPRVWARAASRDGLWERRPEHEDFLALRLGRGPVPLACPLRLDFAFNPSAEHEPNLLAEAEALVERWRALEDQPVVVSLAEERVFSLVGDRSRARGLARALVAQLAAARAPNDLRVAAAFSPAACDEWEWIKWLPHARGSSTAAGDGAAAPLLAESPAALEALLEEHLVPRVEQLTRLSAATGIGGAREVAAPELVLVVDDFDPTGPVARLPLFRQALDQGRELKVSVVCLVARPELEPSQVDARVRLPAGDDPATLEKTGPEGERVDGVRPDSTDAGVGEALARALYPLRLEEPGASLDLSEKIRFTDLIGEARLAGDWRGPSARREQLRTVVGVRDDGKPMVLDLKQAAEDGIGPHGLIVGATGFGKSELLKTIVAGLALEHDPETLALVFVDFKGGLAFAQLAELPHAAGLITNLRDDATLIDRAHDGLLGEVERRERVLRDAGTPEDIAGYRERRKHDPELPPMPYLLVIVDEFGELLARRPELMGLFVTLARVGRGLGIHLLLASQRIDERGLGDLEDHLRYRICLWTQTAEQSKAVLGTADAHELTPVPGVGYLKVHPTTYRLFKTALVSVPHRTAGEEPASGGRAQPFAPLAEGPPEGPAELPPAERGEGERALDVIVRTARERFADSAASVHQVLLPPLEPLLPLDEVGLEQPWWRRSPSAAPTALSVPVGVVDRPREQRKEPLWLDFSGLGGHLAVVGAPQSGKSTVLRTLLSAFLWSYTPGEVQAYCIDLGGGLLRAFDTAPHVGSVCSGLEQEQVRATVAQVKAEIEEREIAFRRRGIESMADLRARRSRGEAEDLPLADVFLVIDNWALFRREFEELELDVEAIAAAGLTYGVHLVVTANRWTEMRAALSDTIGSRVELRLNDPLESEAGRAAAAALPEDVPGRGLAPDGSQLQVALPRLDGRRAREDLAEAIEAHVAGVARRWGGPPARPVRILPLEVLPSQLPEPAGGERGVPIGLEEFRLEPVFLDLEGGGDPHFVVLGDLDSGRTTFLRTFVRGLAARRRPDEAQVVLVDFRGTLVDLAREPHLLGYAHAAAAVEEGLARVRQLVTERLPTGALSPEEVLRGPSWSGPHLYVVVDDYDLVATATANPLASLADLIPHGRDIGLHLVLARRVGGAGRAAFGDPLYQSLIELGTAGLILSGERQEGPLLGGHCASPLPAGRGLLVRRGERAVLVQTVLTPAPSLAGEDEDEGARVTPIHRARRGAAR